MPIIYLHQPSPEKRLVIDTHQPKNSGAFILALYNRQYIPKIAKANSLEDITPFANAGARYILEVNEDPETAKLHTLRHDGGKSLEALLQDANGRTLGRLAISNIDIHERSGMVPLARRIAHSSSATIAACIFHIDAKIVREVFGLPTQE